MQAAPTQNARTKAPTPLLRTHRRRQAAPHLILHPIPGSQLRIRLPNLNQIPSLCNSSPPPQAILCTSQNPVQNTIPAAALI